VEGTSHHSVSSSEVTSKTTNPLPRPQSNRRSLPPSRRVDVGDEEPVISPSPMEQRTARRLMSVHLPPTFSSRTDHGESTKSFSSTQLEPLTEQKVTTPSPQPRSRRRLLVRPPSIHRLDHAESASSLASTELESLAEQKMMMTPSPQRSRRRLLLRLPSIQRLDRGESNKSVASNELESLAQQSIATLSPQRSRRSLQSSRLERMESSHSFASHSTAAELEFLCNNQRSRYKPPASSRTPTPPELLRLTTQSSARNNDHRPNNPVATQLVEPITVQHDNEWIPHQRKNSGPWYPGGSFLPFRNRRASM